MLSGQLHIVRAVQFILVVCSLAFKDLSGQPDEEKISGPLPACWGLLSNLYKLFMGMCVFSHHGPYQFCN